MHTWRSFKCFLFSLLRPLYSRAIFSKNLSAAKIPFCDARARTQGHRHAGQILGASTPALQRCRTSDGDVLENFMLVVEIPSSLLCVCVSPLPL